MAAMVGVRSARERLGVVFNADGSRQVVRRNGCPKRPEGGNMAGDRLVRAAQHFIERRAPREEPGSVGTERL